MGPPAGVGPKGYAVDQGGGKMPLHAKVQDVLATVLFADEPGFRALKLKGYALKLAALRDKAAGAAHYIPKPWRRGLGHIHGAV